MRGGWRGPSDDSSVIGKKLRRGREGRETKKKRREERGSESECKGGKLLDDSLRNRYLPRRDYARWRRCIGGFRRLDTRFGGFRPGDTAHRDRIARRKSELKRLIEGIILDLCHDTDTAAGSNLLCMGYAAWGNGRQPRGGMGPAPRMTRSQ